MIPQRFREQYQGGLVVTWGVEPCLWVMTLGVWERFEQDLYARGDEEGLNDGQRNYLEYTIIGQAQEVELDKIGRLPLPATHRNYANLSKDCMVINGKGRMSIWDCQTFTAYHKAQEANGQPFVNNLRGAQNIFRAV
jgi:MraZ protein